MGGLGEGRPVGGVRLTQAALVVASLLFEVVGLVSVDLYCMLIGSIVLLLSNCVYAFCDARRRIMFLFLHLGMILFWFTRPVIGVFYGTSEWMDTSDSTTMFALGSIYLSMLCLRVGDGAACGLAKTRGERRVPRIFFTRKKGRRKKAFCSFLGDYPCRLVLVHSIRVASLVLFVVSLTASLAYGLQAYIYSSGMSYEEYYLTGTAVYSSGVVTSLSAMLPVAVCAYLATMPSKKMATTVLLLNIGQTIPFLLIGTRGAFVLAIVFLGFYYLLRHMRGDAERWIGPKEILLVAVCLPAGILAMGAMNYVRSSGSLGPEGVLLQLADSLYKQGVTFKTLEYGYNVAPLVESLGFKLYSFGSLVNSITQGFVGQLFLGCELLPSTNSVELALKGSWYSHAVSYYAHDNYLGGEGYGSSYVLELFADFGFAGIVFGNLFLGFVFAFLSKGMGEAWFSTFFGLMAARRIFYMPRGEFCEWVSFLWSTRMLLAFVLLLSMMLLFYFMIINTRRVGCCSIRKDASQVSCCSCGAYGCVNVASCDADSNDDLRCVRERRV